jgi:hypothetical protein
LLEKVVLPLVIFPLKAWIWTWRTTSPEPALISELNGFRRIVVVTYHGMFLQLLAFTRVPARKGRRMVVMLSPSLDGRLLAAFLRHFDVDSVQASTGSRGVAGSRELIRRLDAGDVGLIAVDGPPRPGCVAKAGALRLALTARAEIVLAVTTSSGGITFASWDRSHLPAPFARVELSVERVPRQGLGSSDVAGPVQEGLVRIARRMASPTLPASLAAEPTPDP